MKKFRYLNIFVLMSFLTISCTEKVSDDVEKTKLSEEEQKKVMFKNKAIRVVDKNRDDLSFILHKSGTLSEACELQAPSNGFSSATYDKTSQTYTVDCILDAQEYDIFFHGVNLQLQVDENLCEYVNYKPYRFIKHAVGQTRKTKFNISCDDECGKNYGAFCDKTFLTTNAVPIGKIDPSLLGTYFTDEYLIPDVESLMCEFDYSYVDPNNTELEAGPNCDEGQVTFINYKLESEEVTFASCANATGATQVICEGNGGTWTTETRLECSDAYGAANFPLMSLDERTEFECNGFAGNCLGGPAADEYGASKTGIIYDNESLEYFEHDMKVTSPADKGYRSNMYAANFSRVCSSTGEIKTDAKYDTSLFQIIGHEVEDMPLWTSFNGHSVDEDGNGTVDYFIQSHHLFKGSTFYNLPANNVQPYYAYECLDQARDIKAQIRIFVRDWDKVFEPTNPYVARISDINQAVPQMDGDGLQQVGQVWNDRFDLDDLIDDMDLDKSDGRQPMFLNNQCTSLTYGHCTNRTYLDELSCEVNGGTWRIHPHCDNAAFTTRAGCTGNGDNWVIQNKYQLYPGFSL